MTMRGASVTGSTIRFAPSHDSAFRRELRARAETYLAAHGDHRFADGWLHAKGFALAGLALAAYLALLHAGSALQCVMGYAALTFAAMLLAMNVLHDAAHRALCRTVWMNDVVKRIVAVPVGIDAGFWTIRHVHFHHPFANIEDHDLDIAPNPFLRQTPFQRWLPWFRHQHRYWPLVAALSLPYLAWYADWLDRLGRTSAGTCEAGGERTRWPLFLAGKALHVLFVLAVPMVLLHRHGIGWPTVLAGYLGGQMIASCFLVAMILGTHWAEPGFYRPGANGAMPHTWYTHAFLTSCDWLPRPRWLGYWLGGLNHHLTHHLFPTWSHRHYPALAAIVAELAERHGLPYRVRSYRQLLAAQQAFLKAMGRPQAR